MCSRTISSATLVETFVHIIFIPVHHFVHSLLLHSSFMTYVIINLHLCMCVKQKCLNLNLPRKKIVLWNSFYYHPSYRIL